MSSEKFVYIYETLFTALVRDASTFATFAGLIGLGVYLDSAAMQWAGFICAFLVIFGRASNIKRMSEDEARQFLEERAQSERNRP